MSKRRRFSEDFKVKITLEALRGNQKLAQIAARHKLHPNQISQWKWQSLDGLSGVISGGKSALRRLIWMLRLKTFMPRLGH